jgi:site-specific DNA recombinase
VTMTPRRRCAIYTRKSTEEGLEQAFNSLDAQRESCEAYVLSQAGEGWDCLPDRYDDGGWSGGNMDRPAMKRLLEDIRQGRVDIVVVYKVDRLTRSLMDFARIVETFDSNNVSFVSVTQAFNTTNSMGRLTLNVLLSFAQFEREVTGERIRDKIAASRAKGIYMGGHVPLGYDLGDRRLEVNAEEADRVRHIFTRYIELRSIPALANELAREGIRSKRWVSRNDRTHGDLPFSCGALSHVLNNRVYRGEAVHKGKAYPGEHDAIVDEPLYGAAQAVLAANRHRRTTRKTRAASSPLVGKLHDQDGLPMKMTFSYGRGKLMYRYYVSECLTANGGIGRTDNQQGTRLPATRLERAVSHQLASLSRTEPETIFEAISKASLHNDRLLLEIHIAALTSGAGPSELLLARAQAIDPAARLDGLTLILSIVLPPPRKGRTLLSHDTAMLGGDARAELAALTRTAHLRLAEIDASPHMPGAHSAMKAPASEWIRKRITVGLLAPDVQKALLAGTAPARLTADWVLTQDWPLDWQAQREMVQQLAGLK